MTGVLDLFVVFLSESWAALAGALVLFGMVGILVQVLKAVSGTVIGSKVAWANALSATVGILFIILFGLMGVPALSRAVNVTSEMTACGPLVDLGAAAAQVLGGLAAVRMLHTFVRSAMSIAAGGSNVVASALVEAGEALIGMLIVVVAGPLAAYFFGNC